MSLANNIAKNTTIQLIGKVASTLLGLAAVALMTRQLGVERFGWYITVTGFLQFIGIVSDFGFTVTTANMLSEPPFEKSKLLNTLFTWRLVTALFFQGLSPLLILFFPYPSEVKIGVAIAAVSFFAIALNQIFIGYYQAKLELAIPTIGELVGRVALVLGIAFISFTSGGFFAIMSVITLAALINTGYLWYKNRSVRLQITPEISRALFHKMWPTGLAIICNAFYLQGDRVILPLYVSQVEVGLYGAAYRVVEVIIQTAAMIMGIMLPLVTFAWSRNLAADFKKHSQTSFNLVALFLLPMTAGTFVLSQPIMRFIAGKDFSSAGNLLRWLSISAIGVCFGQVFGHLMLALNRQRQAFWVYLSDAVFSVFGYFIFIPRFGLRGAIGVTIFSEFYAGLLLALLTIYYSRVSLRIAAFLKILLASLLMGIILYWLQPLNIAVSVIVGVLIYGALVLIFKIISPELIREALTFKKLPKFREKWYY